MPLAGSLLCVVVRRTHQYLGSKPNGVRYPHHPRLITITINIRAFGKYPTWAKVGYSSSSSPCARAQAATPVWGAGKILSCVVMVCRTHRGGSIPRVYTERSDKTLGDLELVCNEAVQSRGRGPGIHSIIIQQQ